MQKKSSNFVAEKKRNCPLAYPCAVGEPCLIRPNSVWYRACGLTIEEQELPLEYETENAESDLF